MIGVMTQTKQLIRVGHSPDPDDAFMFHALASDQIATGEYVFEHELVDIETLNQRAFSGELELTAVSVHAYAHLHEKYALCASGASMGDGYGPMVVSKGPVDLHTAMIAAPGTLTSAFLALRLYLGNEYRFTVVPFDRILEAVQEGNYQGQPIDAGLIIHEGQLTYGAQGLKLIVDLGKWWQEETGLPLPLGANAVRKDLGPQVMRDVQRLLRESIRHALQHRQEALEYAMQYGRDLDRQQADRFVGMYVNDWTLDFGAAGRKSVQLFLDRGFETGAIPHRVKPEFIDESIDQ